MSSKFSGAWAAMVFALARDTSLNSHKYIILWNAGKDLAELPSVELQKRLYKETSTWRSQPMLLASQLNQ